MGFSDWIGRRRVKLTEPGAWSGFFGEQSAAGKHVNVETAMQLSTVWACIRLVSQAVAGLPLVLYERDGQGGRRALSDHPLVELLAGSPNEDQTSLEFWEGMVAWLCCNGNAYAEIARSSERIVALQPFPADSVSPFRTNDGELRYRVNFRGRTEEIHRDRIFHLRAFGVGGDLGLSPIRYGVQTFGSATAAEESAAKVLGSGLSASGLLTREGVMTPEQRVQLGEIMKTYVGSSNAGKILVLEGGLKFEAMSLDPETAQLLETRRFNVEEICRWFGVPPTVIGHAAEGITAWGSGIESLLIWWLVSGLNPYLTRIEKRISKQLIAPGERARIYAEFNREGLLQADSAAKAKFLSSMVQNGLMSRNEARAKLNLQRVEGGDALTAQVNLAPLEMLGKVAPGSAPKEDGGDV